MAIAVLNTSAGLSGKTLATLEGTQAFTGAVTVGTTLGVTGATTLSSTLAVTGVATLANASTVLSNASAVLDFSGATAPELRFSGTSGIISSVGGVTIQLDRDNNGGEAFVIKNGAGTATWTLGETGFTTWVGADSVLVLPEVSPPGASGANTCRLYCADNGAGKTRLVVIFPTGGEQVIATEP